VKNKIRAAAVIAVVTTAVSQARDYARENPDEAALTLDKVEEFVRGKAAPKHGAYIDKGSAALRRSLGLPPRSAGASAAGASAATAAGAASTASAASATTDPWLTDPDPDTTEPPASYGVGDSFAPNPSPGTTDDPQPRRQDDDPAPLTPGERPRH